MGVKPCRGDERTFCAVLPARSPGDLPWRQNPGQGMEFLTASQASQQDESGKEERKKVENVGFEIGKILSAQEQREEDGNIFDDIVKLLQIPGDNAEVIPWSCSPVPRRQASRMRMLRDPKFTNRQRGFVPLTRRKDRESFAVEF